MPTGGALHASHERSLTTIPPPCRHCGGIAPACERAMRVSIRLFVVYAVFFPRPILHCQQRTNERTHERTSEQTS